MICSRENHGDGRHLNALIDKCLERSDAVVPISKSKSSLNPEE